IDLAEPPEEMYGKVMSISDTVLIEYFTLTTDVTEAEIDDMQERMAVGTVNPRDLKMRLAREIVAQFHGPRAAKAAEGEFTRIFQRRELPSDMPEFELTAPVALCTFLADAGLARSKSEAKRLTLQGAVEVDGQKVLDPDRLIPVLPVVNSVIRVGKRRFCRALLKHDQ
ncbi:MAG: tyrosine--tRNA ligase, partial [Chloroflexi bacterium]|nr:tyrosine--tRNA ligase [Chloroflexota bacterium]